MNVSMNNIRPRGKYQGVMQILSFNWRFYAAGCVALALGIMGFVFLDLDHSWRMIIALCLATTAFWTLMSLVVSHWVYDRSIICQWTWIADCLPQPPQHWANIHAGLDESTPTLKQLFPAGQGDILDIFDAGEMTEASIAEARRRVANEIPATRVPLLKLPFPDEEFDALFLLFAAHEIRHAETRLKFFAELKRVLKPAGRIVIAEHLRDGRNFLAYGPGCFHFQSRATWLHAARHNGLAVEREFSITPFVRIFVLRK